eukprot:gene15941-biopygen15779
MAYLRPLPPAEASQGGAVGGGGTAARFHCLLQGHQWFPEGRGRAHGPVPRLGGGRSCLRDRRPEHVRPSAGGRVRLEDHARRSGLC